MKHVIYAENFSEFLKLLESAGSVLARAGEIVQRLKLSLRSPLCGVPRYKVVIWTKSEAKP